MARRPAPALERLGFEDLVQLVTDVGSAPANVGALLILGTGAAVAPATLQAELSRRLGGVPRLRQRLAPSRRLGRPCWTADPDADLAAQVTCVRVGPPGDRAALLAAAVDATIQPLPRDRPLWRAVVLTDLTDGVLAVVVVMHHAVVDGTAGLAVLGRLADGGRDDVHVPHRVPAGRSRAGGEPLRDLARTRLAPRTSLNRPTGPRRRLASIDVDLTVVREAARRRAASVNDVLLVAVGAALEVLLEQRREVVGDVVVSVPVSARGSSSHDDLGNRVRVMPVRVAVRGPLPQRLAAVVRITGARRGRGRHGTAPVVAAVFRLLAAAGVYRWFIDRQRLVTTFLSNLRGPEAQLTVAGLEVHGVVPITIAAGNVGIAFAALSYAGTLTVTAISDPDVVPEPETVLGTFRAAIEELTASP